MMLFMCWKINRDKFGWLLREEVLVVLIGNVSNFRIMIFGMVCKIILYWDCWKISRGKFGLVLLMVLVVGKIKISVLEIIVILMVFYLKSLMRVFFLLLLMGSFFLVVVMGLLFLILFCWLIIFMFY